MQNEIFTGKGNLLKRLASTQSRVVGVFFLFVCFCCFWAFFFFATSEVDTNFVWEVWATTLLLFVVVVVAVVVFVFEIIAYQQKQYRTSLSFKDYYNYKIRNINLSHLIIKGFWYPLSLARFSFSDKIPFCVFEHFVCPEVMEVKFRYITVDKHQCKFLASPIFIKFRSW